MPGNNPYARAGRLRCERYQRRRRKRGGFFFAFSVSSSVAWLQWKPPFAEMPTNDPNWKSAMRLRRQTINKYIYKQRKSVCALSDCRFRNGMMEFRYSLLTNLIIKGLENKDETKQSYYRNGLIRAFFIQIGWNPNSWSEIVMTGKIINSYWHPRDW